MSARTQDPIARLFSKIDVRGPDECWPWLGAIGTWGYGNFWLDGTGHNASRAVHLLLIGPLTPTQVARHSCDNPPCSNPAHIYAGSVADNIEDCRQRGRLRGLFSGGARHPRHVAKLTPALVRKARKLYRNGITQTEIGKRLRIHASAISRAVRGETWRHV